MGANQNIPDLDVYGKGRGDFKLPCGYVDANNNVYNHIYLRELTGVEDDILDDDDLNVSERISRVLTNCIEKLTSGVPETPVVDDKKIIAGAVADSLERGLPFTIPDRMAALLFLRRLSMGDMYKFEHKCPTCGKLIKRREVDLRTLKVNYCKDPTKRRVKVKLPRSGREAVLKVITASGERRVAELKPTMKDVKSLAILARLETLDGKPLSGDPQADLEMIKGLPLADRRAIVNTFNLMEGSIETEIELRCTSAACPSPEFKFDLDLGQVFFSNPESEQKAEELSWM
jgi:hypothetical protein